MAFSLQVNYTTASEAVLTFVGRGYRVVSAANPFGH
jgi:hypothetical protein